MKASDILRISPIALAALLCTGTAVAQEGSRLKSELRSTKPDGEVLHIDLDKDGKPDLIERWWNGKRVRWLDEAGTMRPQDQRGDLTNSVLQVDMDGNGLYDGPKDMNIKWCDTNRDGVPDVQAFAINPVKWGPTTEEQTGHPVWMLFINHDKGGVLGWVDWPKFNFHCWDFTGQNNWLPNYHGNNDFVKTHVPPWSLIDTRLNWENPFSFYDEDGDGASEMALRWCAPQPNKKGVIDIPAKVASAHLAFDLDNNSGYGNETTYDMSLECTGAAVDISGMSQPLPGFKGLAKFDPCFQYNQWRRVEEVLRMDRNKGYETLFATPWKQITMAFDEDADDHRWERVEMMAFSAERNKPKGPPVDLYSTARYGNKEGKTPGLSGFFQSDSVGDRGEFDLDGSGGAKIYVGAFDRKLHLYGAEWGAWTVDRKAEFHGGAGEPTKRPVAERINEVVKYTDTDGDGFVDRIEYDYTGSGKTEFKVSLLDYRKEGFDPQKATVIDPAKLGWKGMRDLFAKLAEDSWLEAMELYRAAWKLDLTTDEMDRLAASSTLRQRHMNAYWIKEDLFRELRSRVSARIEKNPAEAGALNKYLADYARAYYTGNLKEMLALLDQVP